MSDDTTQGGVSTLDLLGIVFVVLKLMHYIDWSWWWVTAPWWGDFAFWLVLLVFYDFIYCIFYGE